MRAWRCFAPFDQDPQRYAWSTRLVPQRCETEVIDLLVEVRRAAAADGDDAFDAAQNAAVVAEAERYYRAIGVVYDPARDRANAVPTVMGARYDALVWLEDTTALRPLHHERPPVEPDLETEPSGM